MLSEKKFLTNYVQKNYIKYITLFISQTKKKRFIQENSKITKIRIY